jgi:alcohol dehydrogenase (quinone), cytochrome c subunit
MVLTVMRLLSVRKSDLNSMAIRSLAVICGVFLSVPVSAQTINSAAISRGAYLARAGDCVACHTAGPGQAPFAGGLPINSPFGVIYSTNITPDPIDGIGNFTLDDFSHAVRNGIGKDGRRLYPAMPYPSFTAITDQDVHSLYDYFMIEVAPVRHKPPETKLPFPFNIRLSLWFWDAAFVKYQRFQPRSDQDDVWNRGAYLVQSLGHCGACHTPRGLAFQELAYAETSPNYLNGAEVDNWFATNLRGDPASGLGLWSAADIVAFLKTGHGGKMAAIGSMTDVIENSTQFLSDDDLQAIAHYLKLLPPHGEKSAYQPDRKDVASERSVAVIGAIERPGAGIYQAFCAKCHQINGNGDDSKKYPKLAGNSSLLSENATSLIRLLLEGSATAKTRYEATPIKMPGFATKLTDQQIAEVLSFVRNSWGNNASPVTMRQVSLLRKAVLNTEYR